MTKEDKDPYTYCIPSPMAKFMKKIDERTQMEASLLSMFLLLIGLVAFTTYTALFSDWGIWAKSMTIFNGLCGFVFLFSYLVTTFQQYQALRETQEIVGQFGTEMPFPEATQQQSTSNESNLEEMKGGLEN